MCGIVGFVDKKIADKKPVIEAMMDTIKHRGPNSSGELVNEDTALGFRQLSIIDINSGMQPIYNEDKSKAVIFNGEIYNYQGIREELIKKGLVLLEWKYFPTPKILDPKILTVKLIITV